jgi:dienelactone hydrolase
VQEERVEIGGVPARLYVPRGADGLLLLGHGGGRSKDASRFVNLSRVYAERTRLAVVCIDAVDHGERKPPIGWPTIPPGWHSRFAQQMVDDWRTTADALSAVGPAVAYVGFSMGAIFGIPTVAAMPSLQAAVFVVGGVPTGDGINDPALRSVLLAAAAQLTGVAVLMLNKTDDAIFPAADTRAVYDAIPAADKQLAFWPGVHNHWTAEMIAASVSFINLHTARDERD